MVQSRMNRRGLFKRFLGAATAGAAAKTATGASKAAPADAPVVWKENTSTITLTYGDELPGWARSGEVPVPNPVTDDQTTHFYRGTASVDGIDCLCSFGTRLYRVELTLDHGMDCYNFKGEKIATAYRTER